MPLTYRKFLILSLAILLALIVTSADLFHNHEPDFKDHTDCPVFLLQVILLSIVVYYAIYVLNLFQNTHTLLIKSNLRPVQDFYHFYFGNKAPPAK
jgi:hypothetical protein